MIEWLWHKKRCKMKTTIDFFCIAISYLRMGGGGGGKECGYDTVGWQKTKSNLATE